MISGKIILKSATKLSLDQRFTEIAKQTPPPAPARIQQHTNVIIPQSRKDLFGNKRSATMNIANRLKKRSINYRLGLGTNPAMVRQNQNQNFREPRVFQRLSYGNRRRGGGANSYLFGGQSGMGVRLRGQGRVGTRVFRSQTRGYLNNNAISRFSGFSRRGRNNNNNYKNNNNNNNNNRNRRFQNRPNRGRGRGGGGRGGNKNFNRGRGNNRNNNRKNNNNNNNNNASLTADFLNNDLDKYMAQTKIDNDPIEMNAV